MKFRVSVDDDDAQIVLGQILIRSRSYRPVFEKSRLYLEAANAANFTAGGLPVGGWAPLSPRYAAWKATHYGFAPLMVRTGALAADLASLRGAPNKIGDKEAEFGTNLDYAGFHQTGTFNMPKRQVVYEPAGFTLKVERDIVDHLIPDDINIAPLRNVIF